MTKILLKDLLNFSEEELPNVKVKFNQFNGDVDPMDDYLKNPEVINTTWLFWRNKRRYFYAGQIAVCFLKLTWDTWLLTTVKRVTEELDVFEGVNYTGEEIEKYKSYFGRVIVKYHKTHMTQGRYFAEIMEELEVNQILPATFDGGEFPGYDNVCLSYEQLANIIHKNKRDWMGALENQKAVYLITDKNNGKLYVSSATAEYGMLLQRWSNYVSNGHGGNKELVELVNKEGFDYIKKNFQYSILENYNAKTDDGLVLRRESWWKEALQSRRFGYNSN